MRLVGPGSEGTAMNWKHLSRISQILGSGLVAGLLSWLVWAGAQGLVGVIQNGRIVNRRGPGVYMSDNPIIFWALSGFFCARHHSYGRSGVDLLIALVVLFPTFEPLGEGL